MGIQGLLPLLKPLITQDHLKSLRDKTAVVDVFIWLYKGAFSCAADLGLNVDTVSFLSYPIKMLKLLQAYKIKPICVFDGRHLKAKQATE